MRKIAFIGLGNMGLPMASNLVQSGYEVKGYDINDDLVARAQKAGIDSQNSLSAAIEDRDIIITMLPGSEQSLDVYMGKKGLSKKGLGKDLAEKGVLASVTNKPLLIDCSTISPDVARQIAAKADAQGLMYLDSPVSGGVAGAKAASLTFMVGGEKTAFEMASPIFHCLGQRLFHAGASGSGQAAKICNNMILGVSMIAISEAFSLGQSLGLDARKLFEIISTSSGSCWALLNHHPVPGVVENSAASNDYKPGFASAIMYKDLKLALHAASVVDSPAPLSGLAQSLYAMHVNSGGGDMDYSSILKFLQGGYLQQKQE